MKKYMFSLMLIAASCALPIMAMEFADEQTKKDYEDLFIAIKFQTNYPKLNEFQKVVELEVGLDITKEQKASAYKTYFQTLIKVAIEDRNYFIYTDNPTVKENIPFVYLAIALKALDLLEGSFHRETLREKLEPQNSRDYEKIATLEAEIKTLQELNQKGRDAIEKINDMKEEGKYTPNPEYHVQLKPAHGLSLATYACIAGGIAFGAAAIVGIGYWIKKQFFDKNKQTVHTTNKQHIAS